MLHGRRPGKGGSFAVDASIIRADASRQHGVSGDEQVNWSIQP
ncbi:ISCfr1-like transposase [Pseudomonas lactis]|uniref:ISCfr1-like transposase n=1 Tax=Pseudomonas lactis TaxID=1615674 RepID=I4KE50_9PSED|nr:ISCfr1-like transposase [Pseudomonas lactis]